LAVVLAVAVCPFAFAATYTVEQVPNVQKTDRSQYVSDPDGYLSPGVKAQVNALLANLRDSTTAEAAVVIVGNIDENSDIDEFATELFENWGLGSSANDNGLLFLVAVEDRRFVIRTGYGVEGVLPDGVIALITDRDLVPSFKAGDYDTGVLNTVRTLHEVLTDPVAAKELQAQIDAEEREEWEQFWWFVVGWSCVLTVICALWFSLTALSHRRESAYAKYMACRPLKLPVMVMGIAGAGLPLIVYLILKYKLNMWRNGRHLCPNCHQAMGKLDEESDNAYLTPAQDAEERFDSVDYDVWLCRNCGETDVYSYVNSKSVLQQCPHCHARTLKQMCDRVVLQPTTSREGRGVRQYTCLNCGHNHNAPYNIARLASATPIIIAGGGGFRGGGGSFGGGFGGGHTGGGGFSGGW